ncbi:MAG: hypothetical protein JWO81_2625 [Alphaproteobacteria bacterium]|nr:hypothetical protein [Alphaproteobacteria bacterium]
MTPLDEQNLLELLEASRSRDGEGLHEQITAALGQTEFYERHKEPLVRIGGGCADVRPDALARHVVTYAKANGASATVGALRSMMQIEEVTTATYAFVENVVTTDVIDLGEGLTALPEEAAPHAHFAEAIAKVRGGLSHRRGAILKAQQSSSPFLRARARAGPFPFAGVDTRPPGMDRIETGLKMVTLCGPSCPAIRATSTLVCSDELRLFSVGEAVSYSYPGYWYPGMPKVITDEPRSLAPLYERLGSIDRRRVDTAISRLGLAVARLEPSDAVVELAIALEAVLSDPGNKLELTYRLKLRAALILATGLPERKEIKSLVDELYSERSKVVHGDIPGARDQDLRERGERLVSNLIRKVLTLGSIPHWSHVELTGHA